MGGRSVCGGHFHTSRIDQFTTTSTFCCWCVISRCLSVLVCWHFPRLYLKTIYPPPKKTKKNDKTITLLTCTLTPSLCEKSIFTSGTLFFRPISTLAASSPPNSTFNTCILTWLYFQRCFSDLLSPQAPYSSNPFVHWQPLPHPVPPWVPVFWPDQTTGTVFLTYFHPRHPILSNYSTLAASSPLSPPNSTVSTCILTRLNYWHHSSDLLSPEAPYSANQSLHWQHFPHPGLPLIPVFWPCSTEFKHAELTQWGTVL